MTVAATIDHQAQAIARLALQYQESPNFIAFLLALTAQANEIETVFGKIAEISDIDLAEGVNLDVIGSIVGVSRIVDNVLSVAFFGFEGAPGAQTYGEEGSLSVGGRFRNDEEGNTGTSVLADPEFRLLIRAKIVKNHSTGVGDDVTASLSYLFGGVPAVVDDIGGMAFGVAIGRPLTLTEIALLEQDILPRPAGVRIARRVMYDASSYFGFDGQPGALTFGEEIPIDQPIQYMDGFIEMDGGFVMGGYTEQPNTANSGKLAEEF